jgi:site-specific DNA recombinase
MRSSTTQTVRRCAIYTRKSSEEGLEQDFNSLHAQRESCEAYVSSQKHEGWIVLPTIYEDGGYSAGSMDRPALQRLLADIKSGAVDVVVVYKVDRLTRSLTDFARIVEIFDAPGASFVSVTQQFNTSTSMGRLTLNVLLSFAQFEREVTGERIRDKIAADVAPDSYPVALRVWQLPSCTVGATGQGAEPSASAAPWPDCGEKFAA